MGTAVTGASAVSADEFLALEQKVLRAVDIIRKEREARATAEEELSSARAEIAELHQKLVNADSAQAEVENLNREREVVRQRVEKMLAQMDEML